MDYEIVLSAQVIKYLKKFVKNKVISILLIGTIGNFHQELKQQIKNKCQNAKRAQSPYK